MDDLAVWLLVLLPPAVWGLSTCVQRAERSAVAARACAKSAEAAFSRIFGGGRGIGEDKLASSDLGESGQRYSIGSYFFVLTLP